MAKLNLQVAGHMQREGQAQTLPQPASSCHLQAVSHRYSCGPPVHCITSAQRRKSRRRRASSLPVHGWSDCRSTGVHPSPRCCGGAPPSRRTGSSASRAGLVTRQGAPLPHRDLAWPNRTWIHPGRPRLLSIEAPSASRPSSKPAAEVQSSLNAA